MKKIRRSLVLIEVVAAIALLGSTAVGLLVAQSQALGQLETARRRALGARVARELLAGWQLNEVDVQIADAGSIESDPQWSWRRSVADTRVADSARMKLITVSILHQSPMLGPRRVLHYQWLEKPADDGPR